MRSGKDNARRRQYWRELRSRAWEESREHFAWLYPVATAVIWFVLVLIFQGRDKMMENFVPTLIGAAATVIVAIAVYCISLARAASNIYCEQLLAVESIEGERDRIRDEVKSLTSESAEKLAALQSSLEKRHADQAFADALTEEYSWALHNLVNTPALLDSEQRREWRQNEADWTKRVYEKLQSHGCRRQQLIAFHDLYAAPASPFEFDAFFTAPRNMLRTRLDRLAAIINIYATDSILMPLI